MKVKGNRKRILRYLVYAAVLTSLFASATMAKYSSQFSAAGTFQVAAFAGGGTMDLDIALEGMAPGDVRTMQFAVQNYQGETDCEVQLDYEVQVETTGNLPLAFHLLGQKESDDSSADSMLAGSLDSTLTATGGKLPVVSRDGRKRHTYELSVTWPASETDVDYSDEIDMLTVRVTTKQAVPY